MKSSNPLFPAEQQMFTILAGYNLTNKFRIGLEYNYHKNHLNIPHAYLFGYSAYASLYLTKKFSISYDLTDSIHL